jgi:hypothetical protein
MKRQLGILEKNSGLGVRKRGIASASWATRQLHEASAVRRLSLSPASGLFRGASSMGHRLRSVFVSAGAMPLSRGGADAAGIGAGAGAGAGVARAIRPHPYPYPTYPDATSGRGAARPCPAVADGTRPHDLPRRHGRLRRRDCLVRRAFVNADTHRTRVLAWGTFFCAIIKQESRHPPCGNRLPRKRHRTRLDSRYKHPHPHPHTRARQSAHPHCATPGSKPLINKLQKRLTS